jgi:type 1 fimbria pilin
MNGCRYTLVALLAGLLAPAVALAQGCNLALSPADIDLGQFNRTTVQLSGDEVPLPPRRFSLNLVCDTEQDLVLAYRAAEPSTKGFALGPQGTYRLSVLQAAVDDQRVQWSPVPASAPRASRVSEAAALEDDQGLQPLRAGKLIRGRRLQAQIELQAALAPSVLTAPDAHTLSASGTFAVAGQLTTLQVRTGFAPAACRPTLAGNAQVDFGRIAMSQLQHASVTSFSQPTILDVDCDAPTRFAIRAVDNRTGSVSDRLGLAKPTLFGIGRTAAGQALGGYSVRLGAATGRDGTPSVALLGDTSGQTWRVDRDGFLRSDGQLTALQGVLAPGSAPSAWSGLSLPLTIDLHLAPARELDLRQETPIDGSVTLEIIYL